MKEILETLSRKACNLEELCYGVHNSEAFYAGKKNKEKLIEDVEYELEEFVEALNKLKAIK